MTIRYTHSGVRRAPRCTTTAPDSIDHVIGTPDLVDAGYKAACKRRGITAGFNGRKYRYQAKEGGK